MEADDFLVIAENLTIIYRREVRFFGKSPQANTAFATLRAETASGSLIIAGPFPASMIDNLLVSLQHELGVDRPVICMRDLIDRNTTKITIPPRADQRTVVAVKACG
jgi:hypothetical protein